MQVSTLLGIIEKIGNFFLGFFAFIPQFIYFLYASIASLLDVLQYLIRKLAGLDVYYVQDANGNMQSQTGDILTKFLKGVLGIEGGGEYSALTTVFYSMIIFGCILLVLCTIVAIIKAHYNYDANKANPGKILGGALKTVATMVIVPIVTIFGVYILNALLGAVDAITSPASETVLGNLFTSDAMGKLDSGYPGGNEDGYKAYASFDYFSAGDYTNNASFSGMIFRVAAQNCNRVRTGDYNPSTGQPKVTADGDVVGWSNLGIFEPRDDAADKMENVASQIDFAFANNLHFKSDSRPDAYCYDEAGHLSSSYMFLSAVYRGGLFNIHSCSKFNIGLVWYFYNLWSFNWLIGFAGILMCAGMLGNIVFGLMVRILQVVALFMVFPPLVGISPLDEGQGFATWRKQFVSDILMVVGAVVATNIFFTILPIFDTIKFFNNSFVDGIVNILMIMAGLSLIKKFIGLVSKFAGGSDANEIGQSTRSDVTSVATKALAPVMKGVGLGAAMAKPLVSMAVGSARNKKSRDRQLLQDVQSGRVDRNSLTQHQQNTLSRMENRRARVAKLKNSATDRAMNRKYKMGKLAGKSFNDIYGTNDSNRESAREAYRMLHSFGGKEKRGILKGALSETSDRQRRINIMREAGLYRNKKGDDGTQSRAAAEKHLENKYQRARNIASLLGQDPDKIKKGSITVDKDGNTVIDKGHGVFRGVGQAVVDLGKTTLKTFAQISGASDAWKKLGDVGAVDAAKKTLQTVADAFGVKDDPHLNNENGFDIRTEKDREKEDKNVLKAARQQQLNEQKATTAALKEISKTLTQISTTVGTMANKAGETPTTSGEGGGSSGESGGGGS